MPAIQPIQSNRPQAWRSAFAIVALIILMTTVASAQTFTTLLAFDRTDGATPHAPLVQGLDGNLYGTTSGGGNGAECDSNLGCGTVFKITPSGVLTRLYSFCNLTNCADGGDPQASLLLATNGYFYGTTGDGGNSGSSLYPAGTIFRITSAGALTTLHKFCSLANCTDGGPGASTLIQATDGNFYGVTADGGGGQSNWKDCSAGCGTVFKLTPSGTYSVLHVFCAETNCPDGAIPAGALVQGSDGNLYGTTELGGVYAASNSYTCCGTMFKISLSGVFSTLHSFGNGGPHVPVGGLVQGADGNFYGTANYGGNANNGSIFKITPTGTVTALYGFCRTATPPCAEGTHPVVGLALANDGNFYGTTSSGGTDDDGTIFEITPGKEFTDLYNLCSSCKPSDDASPSALLQATDGNFYGTTDYTCDDCTGTVFKLSTGLSPFVVALPATAKVGVQIKILGTDLTGATSVTFNGETASFHVVSASEITATVPATATTGTIKVTTPTDTLSSNVAFQVQ